MGPDYPQIKPLFVGSGLATTWLCPACSDLHRLARSRKGGFIAYPKDEGCEPVRLSKAAVILHRLDLEALARQIASVLPVTGRVEAMLGLPRVWRLGIAAPSVPVFLALPVSSAHLSSTLATLLLEKHPTFALLTPTGTHVAHAAHRALTTANARHFALAQFFATSPAGQWTTSLAAHDLAGTSPHAGIQHPFVFQEVTGGWQIVFDNAPAFMLGPLGGCRVLDYLFHRPGETIRALQLEHAIFPSKAKIRPGGKITDPGSSESLRNVLKEMRRLRASEERMREEGRDAEADRVAAEILALEKESERLQRPANDDGNRARDNIRKSVDAVHRNLAKRGAAGKLLSDHIRKHLDLGFEIQYRPPPGLEWH